MLAYIDESGYARPNDPSPWNTLVAVCIPETSSRDLSRWLHSTVRSVYPAIDPQEYEVKAASLLGRRQFEHGVLRRRLVSEVTDLLNKLPVSVFAVRARRPATVPTWPASHVDPPHRLLIERIELHMRRDHQGEYAKLVFDETDMGNDAARSRSLRKFMHSTSEGRCWRQVLDVPFFVSSSITPGIQLADLMAGALRHYQLLRDLGATWATEWERAVLKLAELAAAKSQDFTVGSETYFGLYTMPDRYYTHAPGPRAF
jgi:hypothetical protein